MISSLALELSAIVEQVHSLADILDRTAPLLSGKLRADACTFFLLDPEDLRLRLAATSDLERRAFIGLALPLDEGLVGEVVSSLRPLALVRMAEHPHYRTIPELGEDRFQSFLGVPLVIRGRAIGAIVLQFIAAHSYSDEEIQTLQALSAQCVGVIANASLIDALDRGEAARALAPPLPAPVCLTQRPQVISGCAASPGFAIGEVVFRGAYALDAEHTSAPSQGTPAERLRLRDAMEKTKAQIISIQHAAAREADEEHALIFSSHLLMLNDPVLLLSIDQAISGGQTAHVAVDEALRDFGRRMEVVPDPFIQERVEDIHDLRSRLLGHLLRADGQASIAGRIVVASRLPPSLIVEIKVEGALGLLTEVGGTTAHGILLARSMRIPVVTGLINATSLLRAGDLLILDGDAGKVHVNPTTKVTAEYRAAAERSRLPGADLVRLRDLPAVTADGLRVRLQANINIATDLALALDGGAEGVGLYRTEFPFILREQFPTREEQIHIYEKAYEAFPAGPISFRLLDLGGDKFVPGGGVNSARSPFHGYRSIRVLFDHPQVLRDQVQAFALAANGRPLRILIPMVSSLGELRQTKGLIADALAALGPGVPIPTIGVMIETPAAVELAGELARESDFLSIGTNDLIQYTLVVDREDSRMATLADACHPAILRMLRRVILAAHSAGKEVSVCGEMASEPRQALLLLAMGIDGLSVVPAFLPTLKRTLATSKVRPLKAGLDSLLSLPDADSIRAALRTYET